MKQEDKTNRLFPVFLKLEELNTLVVGGGNVGYEKISALLKNSPQAHITLVAPAIQQEIYLYAREFPNLRIRKKEFDEYDLKGMDMVVIAVDNRQLSKEIRQLAKKHKVLANVADTPDLCDFYLGSVVRKGDLKIAISTNGKSPTLSKRIRQYLEEHIPDQDIQGLMDGLHDIRDKIKGDFAMKVKVLNQLTSLMNDDEQKITSN